MKGEACSGGGALQGMGPLWATTLACALATTACRERRIEPPPPAASGGLAPAPPSALGPNAAGAVAPHPITTIPLPEPIAPLPDNPEQRALPPGGDGGSPGHELQIPRGTTL